LVKTNFFNNKTTSEKYLFRMSKLVAINPKLTGLSYELGTHWVTIGRANDNAFQIVETSVSGRHCEVRLRGNELDVLDLRSTNGTFIEGQPITEAVLRSGQILRLGEVELRLEITAPVPSAAFPTTAPAPIKKPEAAGGATKQYRVLFVDDSKAFLETISELFGAWGNTTWEIHTAVSADKALAILEQKLMDLVVLDIGLPLLDGIQLLGIIHQRFPNIKIVGRTGQSDETRRAACLAAGAELVLVKPPHAKGLKAIFNTLNDLVKCTNRDGFSGGLGEVELPNIIQLECMEGHSLIVEVRNSQADGEIYIKTGAIVHASTGRLVGEKAFHQLLSLTNGEFCLKPFREPPEHTLQDQWESLLAKAARARDKGNFSSGDDETILIVKNPAKGKPTPAAQPSSTPDADVSPSKPPPTEPPQSKTGRSALGMDFITVDEMAEADTTMVSNPDGKRRRSDGSKK
jgi:CheY-like chemotaxis protein